MKHWTQRQALTGVSVSPDSINDELRAQQSSITTLDRTQIPVNLVDHTNSEAQHVRADLAERPDGHQWRTDSSAGCKDDWQRLAVHHILCRHFRMDQCHHHSNPERVQRWHTCMANGLGMRWCSLRSVPLAGMSTRAVPNTAVSGFW